MQILRITDLGNDQCGIEALDDNDNLVVCMNWTSAVWNHYPPQAYNPETGHRYEQWEDPIGSGNWTSSNRRMTEAEMLAWAENLIATVGVSPHETPHVMYEAPPA